jgi:hypothetical protein
MRKITPQDIDAWRKNNTSWSRTRNHINIVIDNGDGTSTIVHLAYDGKGQPLPLNDHIAVEVDTNCPKWTRVRPYYNGVDYLMDLYNVVPHAPMIVHDFSLDEIAQGEEIISQMG